MIVAAQLNELSVRTFNLNRKVREDKYDLRTMYDSHEIILYRNKVYIPQPLRDLSHLVTTSLVINRTLILGLARISSGLC